MPKKRKQKYPRKNLKPSPIISDSPNPNSIDTSQQKLQPKIQSEENKHEQNKENAKRHKTETEKRWYDKWNFRIALFVAFTSAIAVYIAIRKDYKEEQQNKSFIDIGAAVTSFESGKKVTYYFVVSNVTKNTVFLDSMAATLAIIGSGATGEVLKKQLESMNKPNWAYNGNYISENNPQEFIRECDFTGTDIYRRLLISEKCMLCLHIRIIYRDAITDKRWLHETFVRIHTPDKPTPWIETNNLYVKNTLLD